MRVRFYLDSRTGQPHIHGHNVTESEVEEVLANPGEDRPGTREPGSLLAGRRPVATFESSTSRTLSPRVSS
jgi:hypothetical protein